MVNPSSPPSVYVRYLVVNSVVVVLVISQPLWPLCPLWLLVVVSSVYLRYLVVNTVVVVVAAATALLSTLTCSAPGNRQQFPLQLPYSPNS